MTAMVKAHLLYFNAGGGHRAATLALASALADAHPAWRVQSSNLMQALDPHRWFVRVTGKQPEDLYNFRLATGFTLGLAQELVLLQAAIRLAHTHLVERMARHLSDSKPDVVVSLVPNFNRVIADAVALARPRAKFVTVMTDLADHPPHFWAEPTTQQHLVCGTPHAVQQALDAGCPPQRVHRVDGMLLRRAFHSLPRRLAPSAREADRQAVGLDAHTPTGLVMFGGAGSRAMLRISQQLADRPLILMCGHNAELAQALRQAKTKAPHVVVGFTLDVVRWMQLADYFIGKPGPGSLSEAVHMGLPAVVTRNAWTMPQERWNTQWLQEQGLGEVRRSFKGLDASIGALCATLPEAQARCMQVHNRAYFQLPQVLANIVSQPERSPWEGSGRTASGWAAPQEAVAH